MPMVRSGHAAASARPKSSAGRVHYSADASRLVFANQQRGKAILAGPEGRATIQRQFGTIRQLDAQIAAALHPLLLQPAPPVAGVVPVRAVRIGLPNAGGHSVDMPSGIEAVG